MVSNCADGNQTQSTRSILYWNDRHDWLMRQNEAHACRHITMSHAISDKITHFHIYIHLYSPYYGRQKHTQLNKQTDNRQTKYKIMRINEVILYLTVVKNIFRFFFNKNMYLYVVNVKKLQFIGTVNRTNVDIQAMFVWLTLPFYDFCSFRSVAVNSV